MNHIHLIANLNIGGAENSLLKICKSELRDKGKKLTIITFLGKGGLYIEFEKLRNNNIEVINLNMKKNFLGKLKYLRNLLSQESTVSITSWMYYACIVQILITINLKKNKKINKIWNIRHSPGNLITQEKWKTSLSIIVLSLFAKNPDIIIYNSFSSMKYHKKIFNRNNVNDIIIYNFFDCKGIINDNKISESSNAKELVVIGVLARNHPMKGHKLLISSLALIEELDIKLIFAGRNILNLKYYIDSNFHKIKEKIELIDEITDKSEFFNQIDILLVPSLWGEACPNVILEAIGNGKLVLATDTGDSKFMLGGNEKLILPKDKVAMKEKIVNSIKENIYKDIELIDSIKKIHEEYFSEDKVIDSYTKIKSI
tara:strand:- start:1145 stop:2257 length:1113 start_codon:yes stop_codon:yes gene_type:complete